MAKQWFFVRQTSGPDKLCLFGPFATRNQAADYGALKASRGFYSMPYGDRADALKAEAGASR